MKRNKKRRSPTLRIKSLKQVDQPRYVNPANNELNWLDELNNRYSTKEKTYPIEALPDASVEETDLKEQAQVLEESIQDTDTIQLVASIPKSVYEYLQQKNLNVTRVFQESLITAMLVAQNQDIFEELKVEMTVVPN